MLVLAAGLVWGLGLGAPRAVRAEAYAYMDYDAILREVQAVARQHPQLVRVIQGEQDLVGRFGTHKLRCGSGECATPILQITHFPSLHPARPEVFLSGELHGDERIGPTAMVETAKLLVEAYERAPGAPSRYGAHRGNPWLRRLVDTRVVFISPITNAWGYHHRQRTEQGVDPNRDFPIDREVGMSAPLPSPSPPPGRAARPGRNACAP